MGSFEPLGQRTGKQPDMLGGLPEMTSIAIGLAAFAYIAAIVAALRLFKHTDGDDESV